MLAAIDPRTPIAKPVSRKLEAWLAGTFILALLLRLVSGIPIARSPDRALWPDSISYISLAENLLSGAGYRSTATAPLDLICTPGCPVFLAVVFATLGKSYTAVVIIHLLMGAAVGLSLWLAAKWILSSAIGFEAALIYALMPNAALWALAVLSIRIVRIPAGPGLGAAPSMLRAKGPWLVLPCRIVARDLGARATRRVVLIPVWGVAIGVWIWGQGGP